MKKFLLTILGVLMALPSIAYDFMVDGLYYRYLSDTEVEVTYKQLHYSGSQAGRDVVVPAKVSYEGKEYDVTAIGDEAFSGERKMKSIVLPESITKIGKLAFHICEDLRSIVIPEGVTSLGEKCFDCCYGLRSITLPSTLETIEAECFDGCVSLKDIVIPEKIKTINSETFFDCAALETIILPESVTEIGREAFANCDKLATVSMPGVTSIGEEAFFYCLDLGSVYMPKVVTLGDRAFGCCESLTSIVLPPSIEEVGLQAFQFCHNLIKSAFPSTLKVSPFRFGVTVRYNPRGVILEDGWIYGPDKESILFAPYTLAGEYVVPDNVKTIGDEAFSRCRFSSVTMTNVTSVGDAAFRNCPNLHTVMLYPSVSGITEGAFEDCSIRKGAYPTTMKNPFREPTYYDCMGYVGYDPETSIIEDGWIFGQNKESILLMPYNFTGDYTVPASVKTIGENAFAFCDGLTSIDLTSVTKIGENAFFDCDGLTSVTIPPTVTAIRNNAFCDAKNIERVDISDLSAWCRINFSSFDTNPLSYGAFLYLNGEKIESRLVLPSDIKSVGFNAFKGYKHIDTVVVPGNIMRLGEFSLDCPNLKNVIFTYSDSPVGIPNFTFTESLTKIYYNRPVGDEFDIPYDNLGTLIIGNDVTEIPAGVFKKAPMLTELRIGTNVKKIGDNAFGNCTSLSKVIIPPSVETVGASAFAGCTGIKSVIMGAHVQNIGEMAFDTCPVTDVYITAPTAPAAFDNTFSNYTATLHVQSSEAVTSYSGSNACWNKFSNFKVMEVPGDIEFDVETVEGEHGTVYQINASFSGVTVTLPWLFFRSSNPEVATVDENGLITLTANKNEGAKVRVSADETAPEGKTSTITILSLYANGPVAKFEISDTGDVSGITDILSDNNTAGEIDYQMPYEVYGLNGMQVATSVENLSGGFYIVRQGKIVKKILVK